MQFNSTNLALTSTPQPIYPDPKEKQIEDKDTHTYTGKILKNCAKFTAHATEITLSPKYSVLINGIQQMNSQSGGDYGRPIGQGIGFLMVLSTPAVLGLKCLLGIPAIIGGSIATTVMAPAYLVEKVANKIGNNLKPSEAALQRKEYTEQFVLRMREILKHFNTAQREEFDKNPESLISIAILVVAFLSRDCQGNELKVADNFLKKEDLKGMDSKAQAYFSKVCKIKSCIQDLKLSPDNDHAWKNLTQLILALKLETNDLQEFDKATLDLLCQENYDLSQMVLEDSLFKSAWKKSLA